MLIKTSNEKCFLSFVRRVRLYKKRLLRDNTKQKSKTEQEVRRRKKLEKGIGLSATLANFSQLVIRRA
jgi:hypothetical protein